METGLRLSTLLALLISCGNTPAPVTPRPITKCVVPEMPSEPLYEPGVCQGPDGVNWNCNPWEQTVGIVTFFVKAREVEAALARCNLVVRVPNG